MTLRLISEFEITEVLSAVARQRREGKLWPVLTNRVCNVLLADAPVLSGLNVVEIRR